MRDQVSAAAHAGLRAATVNSTNLDDWDAVFDDIAGNRLDALLVSPERLGNAGFARRLPALVAATGLVVIDEAHCISDWGFDFRPDRQRLARTLVGIGADTPVLATTATANARVTEDIARQLGAHTLTFRGSLARSVLLPAETDESVWAYFANAGVPDPERVGKIIGALTQRALTLLRHIACAIIASSPNPDPAPVPSGRRERHPARRTADPPPGRALGGVARRRRLGALPHRLAP